MRQIVCEICGGSSFIKKNGLWVCQDCGAKYTPEEAKRLLSEKENNVSENSLIIEDKQKVHQKRKKLGENRRKRIHIILSLVIVSIALIIAVFAIWIAMRTRPDWTKSVTMTHDTDYFKGWKKLETVKIKDGVTSIPDCAFYNCINLTKITIPNSVTSIGEYAFFGCSNLKYNEYDNALYLGNKSNPYLVLVKAKDATISSCVISEETKFIYDFAFYNCTNLSSITIPNTVISIGHCAFEGSRITNLTIPNNVTHIGSSAFLGCSSLTNVTMSNQITGIASYTFMYCTNLTVITIPKSVTWIGECAFDSCFSLTGITYTGTKEQWNAIQKGAAVLPSTGAYTVHCTDGDIVKS